jgi:hypothetical protein
MKKQNQIKGTLIQPASIAQIQDYLEQPTCRGRTQLAQALCEHFSFYDPKGNHQVAGCLKALRELERDGWLGGMGFSAAALHLEARDRWFGWDWAQRQESLHYVVNMSRLLIRNAVCCRNLASRVIGMAVRKMPQDFEARYGYRPLLLESFVDTQQLVPVWEPLAPIKRAQAVRGCICIPPWPSPRQVYRWGCCAVSAPHPTPMRGKRQTDRLQPRLRKRRLLPG